MRMAEFSRVSGVSVATIKMYLREGLLPAGEKHGPNQAVYGDVHLKRLRLVRALVTVGGLNLSAARAVTAAIDSDMPIAEAFEIAQHSVSESVAGEPEPEALRGIDDATAGWHVSPDNPGRLQAARALEAFIAAGQTDARGWVHRYAEAALAVAEADLDEIAERPNRTSKVETVVVGIPVGDALLSGLRRAAQEHVTSQRFGAP
ncbi:MerR family transcriptional regulator [Diaminobutyricimonas sp. TR449]|uniref:MerR family transcriptional regulator n=1 Tax=Diaminobutyricimonas sp. TR449 TaxID=2708076 RepID=UPI001421CCB7|nr:MerR family transcriptional regulator [Diaminobutyricimonas sp. TR449]